VIVKSSIWNEFHFRSWVIVDRNWNIYNKDFKVYIFEFNKNTDWMENFLSMDNFDSVLGYTWNMMITNWMTYLMLQDLDWNELFISKNNPIVTIQKMDIKSLLTSHENWTEKLTEKQLQLILEKSKEDWYPIDNEFLLNRWITWFTPWWVLNTKKWIRENNWIKLLNKSWFKEWLYYNVD
jgi:hypothetical protein